VRRNPTLLWTLVVFFAASIAFSLLRQATENSSTGVTALVQVGALIVLIGVAVLAVRRFR